jgi:predicted AAA+ superfamily ATPase
MAVQVCMDISNPETFKRELVPLIATAKYFNTKENVIITYNQEKSFKEQGVSIKATPAWKWLLN